MVAGIGLRVLHIKGWWRVERKREFVAVTLIAGGAYALVFGLTSGVPLTFLVVPLSVWVALRFDTTLAALHGLFIGVTLIALTMAGRGPFAFQEPQVRVMLAQAFIGVVGRADARARAAPRRAPSCCSTSASSASSNWPPRVTPRSRRRA